MGGELLTRLGHTDEARPELTLAIERCTNRRQRSLLEGKRRDRG